MKIKICGITSLEDAISSIEAGADYLGFNFYPPSPRYITPSKCAQILGELNERRNHVRMVGVFVNELPQNITEILDHCALNEAQLSGDEPIENLISLISCGIQAFKAIRPRSLQTGIEDASRYARSDCSPALLVDAYQPLRYGGTGQTCDWQSAREVSSRYPILLAGGLNANNVAEAIRQAHPWGVDVASGVESLPGKKDRSKLIEFIQAVRQCKLEA
jgi:phosphoribosylanthranilate isomerase